MKMQACYSFVILFLSLFLCLPISSLSPEHIETINEIIKKAPGAQMSFDERLTIATCVEQRAPCNLMVFGVGYDTAFLINLNKGGKTVFLEDNPTWIALTNSLVKNAWVYQVAYNTKRNQWKMLLEDQEKLRMELDEEIEQLQWDVIIVDAPEGWADHTPGRMKSIALAHRLATKNPRPVDVFVHDCDRLIESRYCDFFFGPTYLTSSVDRLRYYTLPGKNVRSAVPQTT